MDRLFLSFYVSFHRSTQIMIRKKIQAIISLLLCGTMLICSCESRQEQKAIKICQESEFHWVEEGFLWNHEKTYTGLDFANIIV